MSGSTQSGDGSTTTAVDDRILNPWLNVEGQAQAVSQGMLDDKLAKYKVAGQDADTMAANNRLNQMVDNNAAGLTTHQGVNMALDAGNYQPDQVQGRDVNYLTGDGTTAGLASQAKARDTEYLTANTHTAGNAADATKQLIDPSKVGSVDAGTLGGMDLHQYENPFQKDVINSTIADWQHGLDLQKNSDKADAAAAGAFGNSRFGVVKANTNDAADRTLASTLAGLNTQNFGQAQAAAQGDLSRGLTAQQSNQGTDLSIQGQNAAQRQQTELANAAAQNQRQEYDTSAKNQMAQFNAGAGNQARSQTAAAQNTANLANASADNQMAQYNAGNKQQFDLANLNAANTARSQTAANDQQARLANQNAGLTANQQSLGAAGLLGNLGAQQQQMGLNTVNALNSQGQINQTQAQSALDAIFKNQQAANDQPLKALQVAESPFQVIPSMGSGGTSNSQSSGKGMGI